MNGAHVVVEGGATALEVTQIRNGKPAKVTAAAGERTDFYLYPGETITVRCPPSAS